MRVNMDQFINFVDSLRDDSTNDLINVIMEGYDAINQDGIIAYHGTDQKFRKFSAKKGAQGVMWFSTDPDIIRRGESGARSSKYIMKVKLHVSKIATPTQYHKQGLGELEDMGYDAIQASKEFFVVFDPKKVEILDYNILDEKI